MRRGVALGLVCESRDQRNKTDAGKDEAVYDGGFKQTSAITQLRATASRSSPSVGMLEYARCFANELTT